MPPSICSARRSPISESLSWFTYFFFFLKATTGRLVEKIEKLSGKFTLGLWLEGWATRCLDFPRTVPVLALTVPCPRNKSVVGSSGLWLNFLGGEQAERWENGRMDERNTGIPVQYLFSLKYLLICLPSTLGHLSIKIKWYKIIQI